MLRTACWRTMASQSVWSRMFDAERAPALQSPWSGLAPDAWVLVPSAHQDGRSEDPHSWVPDHGASPDDNAIWRVSGMVGPLRGCWSLSCTRCQVVYSAATHAAGDPGRAVVGATAPARPSRQLLDERLSRTATSGSLVATFPGNGLPPPAEGGACSS